MRILLTLMFATGIVMLVAFRKSEEKKFNVSLTQKEWVDGWTFIDASVKMLKQSNLPAAQVLQVSDSLQNFMNRLAAQLQPQLIEESKKDTTPKKPNK